MLPLRKTFSRPVSSGWNPAPSSSRADNFPFATTRPWSGTRIRASTFSIVLLPAPLAPTRPNVDPAGTVNDTSRKAQNCSNESRLRRSNACLSVVLRSEKMRKVFQTFSTVISPVVMRI